MLTACLAAAMASRLVVWSDITDAGRPPSPWSSSRSVDIVWTRLRHCSPPRCSSPLCRWHPPRTPFESGVDVWLFPSLSSCWTNGSVFLVIQHPRSGVVIILIVYDCQTVTFESLAIGSLYLHMRHISTDYGSSSYTKVESFYSHLKLRSEITPVLSNIEP